MADFGLVNFADSTLMSVSGTEAGAITPELYFYKEEFGMEKYTSSEAGDVFAFGSVCWQVSSVAVSCFQILILTRDEGV